MPRWLSKLDINFPSVENADEHGILAMGGDFSTERLLQAYRHGIFPWPHDGLILWFCPDPRFVLSPCDFRINRSLHSLLRRTSLVVKTDQNFGTVMELCAKSRRHKEGSWITDDMIEGYFKLHKLGFAHSVEAYDGDLLVGGLYGISLGSIFFGESMFFTQPNASKICFVILMAHLVEWQFSLVDCQSHTTHLEKFGAHFISREQFLTMVKLNQEQDARIGPWNFFISPKAAFDYFKRKPS